jgi:hypothetical protein
MLYRNLLRPALAAALLLSTLVPASAADDWGTVKGKIVVAGAVPPRIKIDVTKDKEHCLAKGDLFSESYVVNAKNKGVQHVIVWLIDAGGDFKTPIPIHPALKGVKGNLVIDQPCCQFIPHVAAIREGQGIEFKNSAAVAHNVHVISKALEFNVILPPGGSKLVPPVNLPADLRPMSVKCDIHPWMNGWVRIFPHPYFAVTDENGQFTIKNAPAGQYRLVLWQETTGWVKGDKKGVPITIKPNGDTDLGTIELTPRTD